jgi:hypothetical protein
MEKDKKTVIASLIVNILITIMMVFASIVMFTGFKFMTGYDVVLESTKLGMFRFFTVQSNMFMGIVALIFAIQEIRLLRGKIKKIAPFMYILKLVATTSVALTFFVVFSYLGPISKNGLVSLLMNANLFFHLLIPVFSILGFVLFERSKAIKFKYTFFGILPTFLYEIYYVSNILGHMENGSVSPMYDWYYFVQNGVHTMYIVAPMMLLISFVICTSLWTLNQKIK